MRIVFLVWLAAAGLSAQTPNELRCEWQVEPIAIQTESPRFSWILTGPEKLRGVSQTAYRVIVASKSVSLDRHLGDMWDSGKVNSSETLQITYAGKAITSSTKYYWEVEVWDQNGIAHWSSNSSFRTGLLYQKDWSASWITAAVSPESEPGLPLLRRDFKLSKKVLNAYVYVSGLGQYQLAINGENVGSGELQPGWSNYRKTILYNAFDVTNSLKTDNTIGVSLGNGMYNIERSKDRYAKFTGSFGPPKLILQAEITFFDHSMLRIVSDHSWRTMQGPITFSSTYGGEDYDARREQPGWNQPGFKERDWLEAQETEGPGGRLIAQQSPATRVMETFGALKVGEPKEGVSVYDLGQNFAGWPEISLKGPRGSSVKLICGELLDRDGMVSQRSTGGPQWFTYILRGDEKETWHPNFSYWGFRYVAVELHPQSGVLPEVLSLRGQFLYAAAAKVGQFQSSDDGLNQIHTLIGAAIKSNLQSILTDCPHREKLGWLEETHLLGSALTYNFDLATLYEKVSRDMADSQQPDGLIPNISPEYVVFEGAFRDSPEWGSAVILDPWLAYQMYGDEDILARNYDVMKRYAAYLGSKASNHILTYGLGDWYDVGPGEPGQSKLTSPGVTATAIYYQDLKVLSSIAALLGHADEQDRYAKEADAVRDAFNARFYNAELHTYDRSSQTAYAIAIATGIAPDLDRPLLVERLVSTIRKNGSHVTAGDIGFHYVVKALMENGRSEMLYEMFSVSDSPSYRFQLARGATALTEAWDANPLSSQNHFMLGHAEEWFYKGLAGIDVDFSRGESQRLMIHPFFVDGVSSASATYQSVFGVISVTWKKQANGITLTLDIPPNLTALVELPPGKYLSENSEGVTRKGPVGKLNTFQVLSGHYDFRSTSVSAIERR